MANFPMVVTNAGIAAQAQAISRSQNFVLDRIKIGRGQYTPVNTATDIRTPFAPVREFTNPSGIVAGSTVQFTFLDEGADSYAVNEIGIFSGNTLYALGSDPSTTLFAKSANTPVIIPITIQLTGVETTRITINPVSYTHLTLPTIYSV